MLTFILIDASIVLLCVQPVGENGVLHPRLSEKSGSVEAATPSESSHLNLIRRLLCQLWKPETFYSTSTNKVTEAGLKDAIVSFALHNVCL